MNLLVTVLPCRFLAFWLLWLCVFGCGFSFYGFGFVWFAISRFYFAVVSVVWYCCLFGLVGVALSLWWFSRWCACVWGGGCASCWFWDLAIWVDCSVGLVVLWCNLGLTGLVVYGIGDIVWFWVCA